MRMLTSNSSICNDIVKKLWLFVKKWIAAEHVSAPENITVDYEITNFNHTLIQTLCIINRCFCSLSWNSQISFTSISYFHSSNTAKNLCGQNRDCSCSDQMQPLHKSFQEMLHQVLVTPEKEIKRLKLTIQIWKV